MHLVCGYMLGHVSDRLRHITIPKCHLETQVSLPYRTIWHPQRSQTFDVRTLVFPKLCNSETLKIPKVTCEILGPQRLWAHRPLGDSQKYLRDLHGPPLFLHLGQFHSLSSSNVFWNIENSRRSPVVEPAFQDCLGFRNWGS